MQKFQNISSSGDLELPLLRRVVAAGEIFEVTEEQAQLLVLQPDVWKSVVDKKETTK